MVRRQPLEKIFRVGFGQALELAWRARQWRRASWFEREGFPLSFWDEEWLGVLGGLLVAKPLYFDNYRSGVLYRPFTSLAEVRLTAGVLNMIVAVDTALERLAVDVPRAVVFQTPLTWKNLLLTLWARHATGLPAILEPLPRAAFAPFFEDLWSQPQPPRTLRPESRAACLQWLADCTGAEHPPDAAAVEDALNGLWAEVESEYAGIRNEDLDPRHMHHFLLG
jgi:hypothetical protein